MDLERLRGGFEFAEGMGGLGSSSESSIYSTCGSSLLNRDLALQGTVEVWCSI